MVGLAAQESGNPDSSNVDTGAQGIWQILPSNWPSWAKQAGLSPSAPKTAGNQRTVAKAQLVAYFKAWGSWDNAARAWYAGPGNHDLHSDAPQRLNGHRYPSVNAYTASALTKVGPLPCQ